MYHALAVIYAPGIRRPNEEFMQRYLTGKANYEVPTSSDGVWALLTLYEDVMSSIMDYVTRAMRFLDPEAKEPPVLSSAELARLQRAFFRHELYCKLFPVSDRDLDLPHDEDYYFSATSQYDKFLCRLEKWEVEELTCAYSYYVSVSVDIMKRISEDFITDATSDPDFVYDSDVGTPPSSSEDEDALPLQEFIARPELALFTDLHHTGSLNLRHDLVASLGVDDVQRLAEEARNGSVAKVLRVYGHAIYYGTYGDALAMEGRTMQSIELPPHSPHRRAQGCPPSRPARAGVRLLSLQEFPRGGMPALRIGRLPLPLSRQGLCLLGRLSTLPTPHHAQLPHAAVHGP